MAHLRNLYASARLLRAFAVRDDVAGPNSQRYATDDVPSRGHLASAGNVVRIVCIVFYVFAVCFVAVPCILVITGSVFWFSFATESATCFWRSGN